MEGRQLLIHLFHLKKVCVGYTENSAIGIDQRCVGEFLMLVLLKKKKKIGLIQSTACSEGSLSPPSPSMEHLSV